MKKNNRVALIVDNPCRDLPGLILIAMRLCQEGNTCFLIPMNLYITECEDLDFDFILLHALFPHDEEFVKKFREVGIRIGILDTEGAVSNAVSGRSGGQFGMGALGSLSSLEAYVLRMSSDPEVRGQVACFCSWGTQLARCASQAEWFREEQIFVTGSPRFDFYTFPWRSASLRMLEDADRLPSPIILINTSFPLANPRNKTPEREKEMMQTLFNFPADYLESSHTLQKQAMAGMAELANDLTRRFPRVTFVFRPHPFEKLETYRPLLDRRPNLHLLRIGTVDSWLLRAKALISWNSSTAVEAGLAGIPALSPLWLPTPAPVPVVDDLVVACSTKEEMVQRVEDIVTGRFNISPERQERLREIVADWFYRVDGYSHQRVTSAIQQVLLNGWAEAIRPPIRRRLYLNPGRRQTNRLRTNVAHRIKEALGLPFHWSLLKWEPIEERRWDGSSKQFDVDSVRRWTEMLYEISQSDENLRLGPVGVEVVRRRSRLPGHSWGRSIRLYPLNRGT